MQAAKLSTTKKHRPKARHRPKVKADAVILRDEETAPGPRYRFWGVRLSFCALSRVSST